MAACQNVNLRHASAAKLIKSAHLTAAAMPKIVVARHHELSSIIMNQIVLATFASQYYSNHLVQLFTTWIYIKILDFSTAYNDFNK